MLHAVTNYFYERRRGLARTAGYAGGVWLIGKYISGRLGEVRDKVIQDRQARENLRRRFEQNQQDISFTIMALLPTLGQCIIEGMDVEGVTQELQSQSRAAKVAAIQESHSQVIMPPPPSESSLASSIELAPVHEHNHTHEHDARSENDSVSVISLTSPEDGTSISDLAASSQSWVDRFSSTQSSQHLPSNEPSSSSGSQHTADSPKSNVGTDLSDSVVTNSSAVSYGDTAVVPPQPTSSYPSVPQRSKAELWREVKMLTFTRTLTIIYSMTLLSLFTHVQLNVLGRTKYLQSILQLAEDEKMREQLEQSLSISALLWGGPNIEEGNSDGEFLEVENISEETERKYLTLSWWILHVGWKDVGERVRRGVEEVFDSVSLKTKLSASDLHRLVSDVRRRVEHEVTFEGRERRINFMSTLLPPTTETLQHVLTQGGIPARLATYPDPTFQNLLSETRTHLSSASFQIVLEACLDKATEILFNGLEKNVFRETNVGGWEEVTSTTLPLGPEVRVRLAGMLPGLGKWCHLALEGLPNELIDGLADLREVSALSAIIYSSYDDRFR
ncbi:Peroxin-3 [Abortiporus biennis]|nr:Peroxin-3 [Abortiporus biennis]